MSDLKFPLQKLLTARSYHLSRKGDRAEPLKEGYPEVAHLSVFRSTIKPGSRHRHKHRRRSGSYKSWGKLAAIATGILLATVVAYLAKNVRPLNAPSFRISDQAAIQPIENRQRRIYPYSIIPGGVINAEELAAKLAIDQTAARHYSGF